MQADLIAGIDALTGKIIRTQTLGSSRFKNIFSLD
jgi:hypothetical protein